MTMTFQDMLKTAMVERLNLPDNHLYLFTAVPIDEDYKGPKNYDSANEIVRNIIPAGLHKPSTELLEKYFDSHFDYLTFRDRLMIEVERLK